MRGTIAIPLELYSAALIANVPPHVAPPNSITAGYNVFHDIDGLIKPRPGYQPFLAVANVPGSPRLHGGAGWQDQNGNFQYVVASDTDWFADIAGVWTTITGSSPNTGDAADPARFQVYYQNGVANVIGVDNASTPKWWTPANSTYTTLGSNTYSVTNIVGNGTVATVTITAAVTNILAGDSVTIAGNSDSQFNGTFTVSTVTSGTVFTFASTENATGTGGTITNNTLIAAPAARDIEIVANRVVFVNTTEGGTRYPRRVRWSASGDATRWPQLAYIDILDADDPIVAVAASGSNLAVIYGEQSFFFLEAVAGSDYSAFATYRMTQTEGAIGPVSPASVVRAEGLHYYTGFDGRVYNFNGSGIVPVSMAADPTFIGAFDSGNATRSHGAYLPGLRQVWLWTPTQQLTTVSDDPSVGEVFDLAQQVVLPPQLFSEGITGSFTATDNSGVTWLNAQGTWTTFPYTWENCPTGLSTDIFTMTATGEVDRFFHGYLDGATGYAVPWSFTYNLFNAGSRLNNAVLNRAELFFKPTSTTEVATAQFNSLAYPFDPGTPLVSFALALSEGWINMPVEPGPTNPNNIRSNYLQLSIFSSESLGSMAFGGGTLFLFPDTRGEYANQ